MTNKEMRFSSSSDDQDTFEHVVQAFVHTAENKTISKVTSNMKKKSLIPARTLTKKIPTECDTDAIELSENVKTDASCSKFDNSTSTYSARFTASQSPSHRLNKIRTKLYRSTSQANLTEVLKPDSFVWTFDLETEEDEFILVFLTGITDTLYADFEFRNIWPANLVTKLTPDINNLSFVVIQHKWKKNIFSIYVKKKCYVCRINMSIFFCLLNKGLSYLYDNIAEQRVHPYQVNTFELVHEECLEAIYKKSKGCNYLFKLLKEDKPLLQWWNKDGLPDMLYMIFYLIILGLFLIIFFYCILDEYRNITSIMILSTVSLWLITFILISHKFGLYWTRGQFLQFWKRWREGNRQIRLIIWKPEYNNINP